jgi:hypothetical protein
MNTKANRITRRKFLQGTGMALLGTLLGSCAISKVARTTYTQDQTLTPEAYLPVIQRSGAAPTPTPTNTPTASATPTTEPTPDNTPIPGAPIVVHVHEPDATDWDGSGWYGDAVNQSVVDTMVQQGLQELTAESSWTDIWNDLFSQVQPSGYQVGQKIAIKVSFNNSWNGGCSGTYNQIDALPHPVKALIGGLVAAGVEQDDIWVYDATQEDGRIIPDRFRIPIQSSLPDVQFYGQDTCSGVNPVSHGGHSSLTIEFSDPGGNLTDRLLTDVLYDATYLINMPIVKRHGIHPVSLGFKNHFGSINNIVRGGNDDLHIYISPLESLYSPNYSPLVDIFENPNIKNKTILTVGDALYGAYGATAVPPTSWESFEDAPNSLLFAKDPVAIDCVMIDLLVAEGWVGDDAYDYLFVAEGAGLGVCEGTPENAGGDPWQTPYGSGYSKIAYRRIGA